MSRQLSLIEGGEGLPQMSNPQEAEPIPAEILKLSDDLHDAGLPDLSGLLHQQTVRYQRLLRYCSFILTATTNEGGE